MKYIRTKDSVYEVNHSNYEIIEGFTIVDAINKGIIGIRTESIIKQADTIEELCDEFVCLEPNGKHSILPSNNIIGILGTEIYGAIWTEWGLKYVAKMNEKGYLELL